MGRKDGICRKEGQEDQWGEEQREGEEHIMVGQKDRMWKKQGVELEGKQWGVQKEGKRHKERAVSV